MKLDISTFPFSRYGSFMAINFDKENKKLMIRDVHGGDESPSELFEISLLNQNGSIIEWDKDIEFEVTETLFKMSNNNGGTVEIIFPEEDSLHIRVKNMPIRFIADKVRYDTFNQMSKNIFEYISYKKETKYELNFLNNDYKVDAPWESVGNKYINIDLTGQNELYIYQYKVVSDGRYPKKFVESKEKTKKEYRDWLDSMPQVPDKYKPSRDLASYILWTNTVRKEGLLKCDVTFMSKNWMQNIWSWDNCFTSIALAENHPELAYNQYKIFMDYQDESGAYPDFINDKYVSYNCVKPPIFAWGYKRMIERNPIFLEPKYFEKIYESLKKNTDYWIKYRVHPITDMMYYTHGNDSGWDNSSVFQEGLPVSSPDLVAFIVRQLDILSEFAKKLGKSEEVEIFKNEANKYFDVLMQDYFNGEQFVAFNAMTGKEVSHKTSALLFIPLIVSYRMKEKTVEKLVGQLINRFESPHGIMTEEPASEFFKEDGYWLGPIWAPETFIFIDALNIAGYTEIANRLSRSFAELTLIGGMAENFNPYTGIGNDDLAFAWPSAVFLSITKTLK